MEINLPDLNEIVCKAIPHEPKDCHLMRDVRLQRREWLEVRIKEYAEQFHLMKLKETRSIVSVWDTNIELPQGTLTKTVIDDNDTETVWHPV